MPTSIYLLCFYYPDAVVLLIFHVYQQIFLTWNYLNILFHGGACSPFLYMHEFCSAHANDSCDRERKEAWSFPCRMESVWKSPTGPADLVDHYVSGFKIYILSVGSRPSLKEASGIWMENTDLSIWYIYWQCDMVL